MASKAAGKKVSVEEQRRIIGEFNQLRQKQRDVAEKAAEMEMELQEHRAVIDTIKDMDESRKCFRMVGGVLTERTVGDVLPSLRHNERNLVALIQQLKTQIEDVGKELTAYREKHNIQFQNTSDDAVKPKEDSEAGSDSNKSKPGVLVA